MRAGTRMLRGRTHHPNTTEVPNLPQDGSAYPYTRATTCQVTRITCSASTGLGRRPGGDDDVMGAHNRTDRGNDLIGESERPL